MVTLTLGALGGFTSFVAHAGAAPIKMLLIAENLPKRVFVATNSYLFAAINILKAFPYFWLGQFTSENLTYSAALIPLTLLGIVLGYWLQGKVSQVLFDRILIWSLTGAGIKLIWDGLAAVL